jgi:hypothetical protein
MQLGNEFSSPIESPTITDSDTIIARCILLKEKEVWYV